MTPSSQDAVAWVRRVNARWLVQPALKHSTSEYLDHLMAHDPARMVRSCGIARRLSEKHGDEEDPKPWFYAGVFSLATLAEARRFLPDHAFTCAAIPTLAAALPEALDQDAVSPDTWEKIARIRSSLSQPLEEIDAE